MNEVEFMNEPALLVGNALELGDKAAVCTLTAPDLSEIRVGKSERVQIIMSVPSLDMPGCGDELRKFDQLTAGFRNTEAIVVSMDLPFAAEKFRAANGIRNLRFASDFRAKDFARSYGMLIGGGALAGLCAKALFIIDSLGVTVYKQVVSEVEREPDFEAMMDLARIISRNSCSN